MFCASKQRNRPIVAARYCIFVHIVCCMRWYGWIRVIVVVVQQASHTLSHTPSHGVGSLVWVSVYFPIIISSSSSSTKGKKRSQTAKSIGAMRMNSILLECVFGLHIWECDDHDAMARHSHSHVAHTIACINDEIGMSVNKIILNGLLAWSVCLAFWCVIPRNPVAHLWWRRF